MKRQLLSWLPTLLASTTIGLIPSAYAATGISLSDKPRQNYQAQIQATNFIVKGTVKDSNGQPMIGVSIGVKGKPTGTSSDANGNFEVSIEDNNDVLIFSFVGYTKQEVTVGTKRTFDIVLAEDQQRLSEVVVVGYSSQSKRDLTSAVVSIQAEELNKRIATSPVQLLQGKLPGLQIVQSSGEPGNEGFQIQVRGKGTFSGAGSNPLVIVDGLPGDMNSLNPNDIESVTVLKDAASATIYGSRGANGVIVVTTKKGKKDGLELSINSNISFQRATRLPELVTSSAEYMQLYNEGLTNYGQGAAFNDATINLYKNNTDPSKFVNFDWQDAMVQTAVTKNSIIGVTGKSGNSQYNLSLGYNDQTGIFKGFDYKKYTSQISFQSKALNRITFGINTLWKYSNKDAPRQGGSDQMLSTMSAQPFIAPQMANGGWVGSADFREYGGSQWGMGNKNPVAIANTATKKTDSFYLQSNIFLNVNVLKGLDWENRVGLNYGTNKENDFRPHLPQYDMISGAFTRWLDVGREGLRLENNFSKHVTVYSQLHYNYDISKDIRLDAIAGAQQEYDRYDNMSATREGTFPSLSIRELNGGPTSAMLNDGYAEEWAMRSLYGSANLSIKDKYLLGTSLRYDGSSRLPKNSRWGLFYSFSGGWRVSEERFMDNVEWLNDLKLRASWGKLGNQNIGTYPYQSQLNAAPYAFGTSVSAGYAPGAYADPNLTWENTQVTDFGFDAQFLGGKLTTTLDWYQKTTSDILRGSQVPDYFGLNAPTVNNGTMQNKGFEFQAGYRDHVGKDFSWNASLSLDAFRNKLIKFGADEYDGWNRTIKREGLEWESFYMIETEGIFQTQAEIDAHADQTSFGFTPTPGDLKLKDQNGDGKVDLVNDRVPLKGQYPKLNYSFNLGAEYKGFDLSIFMYGSQGRKMAMRWWGIDPFFQESAPLTEWRNRWTPENHSTTMPKIYRASWGATGTQRLDQSSWYLRDVSYFRIKSITVGYNIPKRVLKVASARVYFSGDNLFSFSKFKVGDPEKGYGIDYGSPAAYPQVTSYTFGLNLKF